MSSTDTDMERVARRIVSLEKRHDALARARQLAASSVVLADGTSQSVAEGVSAGADAAAGVGRLDGQVDDLGGVTDAEVEHSTAVPDWIDAAAEQSMVAWDSTQFAVDLARELETELGAAQAELTQALADSATALADAGLARSEAATAVTNAAAAVAQAQQAIADAGGANTSAQAAASAAAAAQVTAADAAAAAVAAHATANSKGKTIIQAGAPAVADQLAQNLWIDTMGGANTPKRWSGSAWVAVTDKAATDAAAAAVAAQAKADTAFANAAAAATAAGNAQTSANGKNAVWYLGTAPAGTGHKVDDVWFDTANGVRMSRWSGSAWAVQQFGTAAIGNLAITNALIANATIQDAKIATLDAAKITTGLLAAARIEALSITADKIAANTITAAKILGGTITAAELAANSVTAVKIAADAVIAAKIQAGAVTTDKLFALAVTAEKIAAGAIIADKIAANAITTAKLAATAIDGMVITGATMRTAATGQRMQFDTNGLSAYDAANTLTATLGTDSAGFAVKKGLDFIGMVPKFGISEGVSSDAAREGNWGLTTNGLSISRPGSKVLTFTFLGPAGGPNAARIASSVPFNIAAPGNLTLGMFGGSSAGTTCAIEHEFLTAGFATLAALDVSTGVRVRNRVTFGADGTGQGTIGSITNNASTGGIVIRAGDRGITPDNRVEIESGAGGDVTLKAATGQKIRMLSPVEFPGDTDWVQLNGWTGGFAHGSGVPVKYRRRNGYVEIMGSLTNSGWSGNYTSFGGSMPPEFRPIQNVDFTMAGNSTVVRTVQFRPDGGIYLYGNVNSGAWWNFMARYAID